MPIPAHLRATFATVLTLIAALTGCGAIGGADQPAGVSATTVTIGTTNPLTGSIASACKPVSDGAKAWFDHVNRQGGIHGRKIDNKVLDDAFTAPQALQNARQFVRDGVLAVFGGCGSIQPPSILPVLQKSKVPYLFPYAALPNLTNHPAPDVFLVLPEYTGQLSGLLKAAFPKYGPGRVFMANIQIPGAPSTLAAVRTTTQRLGGTFAGVETTVSGTADYTPLVLKMKAARPDYVVLAQSAPDGARIVKTMQAQNAFPAKRILATAPMATESFLGPAGALVNDKLFTASPVVAPESAQAATCRTAFQEADPRVSAGGFSLFGCGTAQMLIAALQEAGKDVTREKLVKVLNGWRNKKASPVFPALSFGGSGHLGVSSMVMFGIQGGRFVDHGPLQLAG